MPEASVTRPPTHALTALALQALREVNIATLELLTDIAGSYAAAPGVFQLPLDARQRLQRSTTQARMQLAQVPALLVDLEFQNATWWAAVTQVRSRIAMPPMPYAQTHRRHLLALTRATLTYAANIAQHDQAGALILLGLSPAVREHLANLSPLQVQPLATRTWWHLRPRWQDRPALWSQLLREALKPETSRLSHIHCLQLIDDRPLFATQKTPNESCLSDTPG